MTTHSPVALPMAIAALAVTFAATFAAPARAVEAPDYFVQSIFDATTAEQLAIFCDSVDMDPEGAQAATNALLERLAGDGFDDPAVYPTFTGVEEGVSTRQDAFVARYALDDPTGDKVCEAARAEMAAGSGISEYLKEATQ
ncbi:MAG: DUF5333 family protein [Pseudomonadota bacterium]